MKFSLLAPGVLAIAAFAATSFGEVAADSKPTLIQAGKPAYETDFSGSLGKEWTVNKGDWEAKDGVLAGREKAEDKHAAVLTLGRAVQNSAIRFAFKLEGAKLFSLSLNSMKGGHLFRLTATSEGVALNKDRDKKDPKSRAEALAKAAVNLGDGKWHTLLLEMKGGEVAVQLDEGVKLKANNAALDVGKTGYRFVTAGASVLVDDVKVWDEGH